MSFVVKELRKSYGNKVAVENLSFTMDHPGVFGLLGTNGAGKTTTIRMILEMLKKDNGKVYWDGQVFNPKAVSTGYLAEERGIYSKYTIVDQLLYFAELKGMTKAAANNSINYWLKRLEIEDYRNKRAEQLSKGNQQKVQFIAALISNPDLLILDEPLSGLDPVNSDLFKEVIKEEVAKGKYIIMSSHQMDVIEEFCENLVILNKGKVVLQGNLNDIKKSYGRNHLILKCEESIDDLIEGSDLNVIKKNVEYTEIIVNEEKQAMSLLREILDRNIGIIRFELREPTLHEIFIERVGD